MKKTLFAIFAAMAAISISTSCTKERLSPNSSPAPEYTVAAHEAEQISIPLMATNPELELFNVYYGYADNTHLEGYGSIDMTVIGVEIVSTNKSLYHLMYAEGILRSINEAEYSETIWTASAPKINWEKPSFSELPYFLHYKDAVRTAEVDMNKLAGHAAEDYYQVVEIYYIDSSNKVYHTELNWDDMNTIPEIELTTENR